MHTPTTKPQKASEQLELCHAPTLADPWRQRWTVESRSEPGTVYTVALSAVGRQWGCSCPSWIYRRAVCPHIRQIQRTGDLEL